MALTRYAIAFGSNRRSHHGSPAETLKSAAERLGVELLSSIHSTLPLGPAGRTFANAAGILATNIDPSELLDRLKDVEHRFGRRPGRRWGARTLDLDIVLWSGGRWTEDGLVVPHPEFRRRIFVLSPLAEIAAGWRDPVTGATVRQLLHRLRRGTPVDRAPAPLVGQRRSAGP